MLFGRAQEEIDALRQASVAVEIVPGVSAALSASADIGQSLTERGISRSVTLLTPRVGSGENAHDWARSAATADTIALYMAGRQASVISEGLIAAGVCPSRPAIFVENASLASRRIIATRVGDLVDSAKQLGDGPALLLVGTVYESIVSANLPLSTALRFIA
jgi:siroheme synthase